MDTSEPCYSIETLVEALYRGVLSRASDEKGFWSNVKSLALRGGEATDLASFVENFLSSQECQNKAARQFARGLLPTSTLQNCEPVDIVSLGSHCLVSYALKEMGLKRYSCPFDWIFSRPSMVEHCIKDSFVTLTDRSQYQSVTDESGTELPGCCHHAFYRNLFGVNRVFNHRDMRIKRNYEYLVRSVDRFTKLLASFNPKIFVILTPEWHINNEQFVSLHNTLSESTSNFWLFVVSLRMPRHDMSNFGIDYVKSIGPSYLATMKPTSNAGPFSFEDPLDDFIFRRAIVAFKVQARNTPLTEINV